ncbi:hypothetical protein ElyMa_004391500 [Elysia marginata]|uniref:Uncharacterized protein n=1 Tax=Elysia marginata TaxID=1093978 RepID=A0AAV4H8G2_9GAST|nr:hypothetical protein ElyMa_004391500 [Elysia marginata]
MSIITQYKKERRPADSEDPSIADKLNEFYAWFDRENTSTPVKHPCDYYDPTFSRHRAENKALSDKARYEQGCRAYNIKPHLLKTCSLATSWHQSSPVFSIGISLHEAYRCVSNHQQSYQCRRNTE